MTLSFLDNQRTRRLFLDRHLLLRPGSGSGKGTDLDDVLQGLGFVQVDSIDTLAHAHDLILWSRRGRYRRKALENLIARDRTAFEHWTHDASVIPISFYPVWRLKFERDEARMQARWSHDRREGWLAEIDAVLKHIADNGATCSLDVGSDERKGSSIWLMLILSNSPMAGCRTETEPMRCSPRNVAKSVRHFAKCPGAAQEADPASSAQPLPAPYARSKQHRCLLGYRFVEIHSRAG